MKSSRTPVYPSQIRRKKPLDAQESSVSPSEEADGYLEKLAKYVPGEIIVAFISLYTLISTEFLDESLKIASYVLLGGCALMSIGYSWVRKPEPLPFFFYVLSIPAFAGWAIGTSNIGEALWGWSDGKSKLALIGVAVVIPFLDQAATKLFLQPKS